MFNKTKNVYDFTFVLPGFTFTPPGGYLVVLELANYLLDNGQKVCVIFLEDIENGLFKITNDDALKTLKLSTKYKVYKKLPGKLVIEIVIFLLNTKLGGLLKKFLTVREEFISTFKAEIKHYKVCKSIPKGLKTKRIVATAWQTAYFVNLFSGCNLKYYLVQHGEDDFSFSGFQSGLARNSYSFKLKKIVINKLMMERFKDENPVKITVTAHIKGRVKFKPEDRRKKIILVQLRSGADKGADIAIDAAKLVNSYDPNIEFISYGNYIGYIPSFINHQGYVSDHRYVELFNVASIFILPSRVEGFSTPVLEAMSCGCVPIATKCGGPEEMIEHMFNGILVPVNDPKSIAEQILWLIDHDEMRITMAYNAVSTSQNYSKEKMGYEFITGITKYEDEALGVHNAL